MGEIYCDSLGKLLFSPYITSVQTVENRKHYLFMKQITVHFIAMPHKTRWCSPVDNRANSTTRQFAICNSPLGLSQQVEKKLWEILCLLKNKFIVQKQEKISI